MRGSAYMTRITQTGKSAMAVSTAPVYWLAQRCSSTTANIAQPSLPLTASCDEQVAVA
jgi:hypothetical protein